MSSTSTFDTWVSWRSPNPQASLRLFCFPYAGGAALTFRTWPDSLPRALEVCPVELPGRGKRIMIAILPYLDKPFAFFGHSMGGLVSFELARLLRKNYGKSPVYLFVSGYRAPQVPDPDPPIHALPEPEFLEELRQLNGTPEAVLENTELMQLLLPAIRADFAVIETYTHAPESSLDCPITAFGGLQDREVSCDDLKAWQEQTNAAFSLHMLPGDHFFLQSAHALLLQSLSQELYAYV